MDHQAAIIQIGPMEALAFILVCVTFTAAISALLMHTRLNPYVQDRARLLDSHEAVVTVSVNLRNLATYVGASALLQDTPERADEFGRRMDALIGQFRGPGTKKRRDDDSS